MRRLILALLLSCSSGFLLQPAALQPAALLARRRCMRSARWPVAMTRSLKELPNQDAYDKAIETAREADKVVVIKFYASWCRACKAMSPKYQRVAEEWPNVEFCEILFDNNKQLCKSLGIKILPYIEIVGGKSGKVEGFSCGPSKISKLEEKLETVGAHTREEIPCTDITALMSE